MVYSEHSGLEWLNHPYNHGKLLVMNGIMVTELMVELPRVNYGG